MKDCADGPAAMIGQAFQALDLMRRAQGIGMSLCGFGPMQTPSRVVASLRALRLRSYGGGGPPVLLVPAPIKRHYIWDLDPAVSVVRRCLAAGHAVYLCEWLDGAPSSFGLRELVAELAGALQEVRRAAGAPVVMGHSLGGTLAAMAAAERSDEVAALVLIEAPLHFGSDTGTFFRLIASVPANLLPSGGVPGSYLTSFAAMAAPETFQLGRIKDLLSTVADPQGFVRHVRVERWALDELALPCRLLVDLIILLHRQDAFFHGTLDLGRGRLGPHRLTMPLLQVVDPDSRIVPASAVLPFHRAAAAKVKAVLEAKPEPGTGFPHVTALVGPCAHERVWPRILDWAAAAREALLLK